MTEKPTYEELERRVQELEKAEIKRKQTEKELQDSQNMLRIVLDTIPSGVFWKNCDSIYNGCNRTWQLWAGLSSSAKVIGKSDYELPWSKEEAESFREADRKVMESGIPEYDIIEPYFRSNGTQAWAKTNKVPLRDKEGNIIGILGTSEDITERKRYEDALGESEERYRILIENLPQKIFLKDRNSTYISCNKSYAEDLGIESNQIAGKTDYDFFPKQLAEKYRTDDKRIMNSGEIVELQEKYIKNGQEFWVNTVKIPVKDIDGNIISILGIFWDITEKKRYEEQLRQTHKLEAIGTLAGGIAHDFNNMLGVIIGNISYALSTLNKNDELYEVLSDAQESSKQAQSLTHQLLTFSKGGVPIKKVSSINQLLTESAIFSTRGAKANCKFKLSDILWTAEVDEGQINQVIGNLVINANQAMPNGGTITIRTENVTIVPESGIPLPAGRYVKIVVEDQGIGISKKHLPKIFEPYFTTKQKGSGLGLATAYSIIKRHGGHITVYSEIEKGTVFNIYLPASLMGVKVAKDKGEPKHTGKGKILIMDDQESILKMLGRILSNMGYETEFAMDGSEAIVKYREANQNQKPYHLVILDLTVPGGMGGAKTIPELLKIDPKVKAVVSSGYSNDPIMGNYEDYGFCGVIPKPYTKDQLAKLLIRIFGQNK